MRDEEQDQQTAETGTEPAAVEDLELTEEDRPEDVTGGSGYDGRGDGPVFNHAEPCLGSTDLR